MANQIVVSAGAKVRNLSGVLTATSGVVSFLPIDVSLGIPQLDVNGKILVSQLPNSVMEYKGTWNAATNTPTLVNGTGNQGDVYLCNVAGTVNFGAGPIAFVVGDQVIYSGSIWQRASGATGTVTSVAITESGDSLNITGSPITTSGTINIGFNGTNLQYVNGAGNLTTFPDLTGFVPYTGATNSVDLGAFLLTASGVDSVGYTARGSGTLSGYLILKQGTTFLGNVVGYNSINANSTKYTFISDVDGTNYKSASFELGSLANNTARTYTLPNANGTIALTSDIPSLTGYVPYTGATANVDLGVYDLTADLITGARGSFASNGGSDTFAINHSSGGGIALNITKGGSGEGLYINKTSGSGNAATIVGTLEATTLVKSGGTSSQFLKADGTVDSNTYALDSAVVHLAGTETITGSKTFTGSATFNNTLGNSIILNYGAALVKGNTPSSTSGVWSNIYAAAGNNNLVIADNANISKLQFQAASSYTYTFPAATGTIALTSDLTGGTVTSVAMTVPTGLSVSGSPITTSGTLAVSLASGYSIPTTASQTNWDTAYTNRITSATAPLSIISNVIAMSQASGSVDGFLSRFDWTTFNNKQATITLTTTGTSGAATFTSNTLNIPNYAPDLSGYVTLATTQTISGAKTFTSALVGTTATFTNSAITTSVLYTNNNSSGAQHYQDFGNGGGFVAGRILRGNGASGYSANGLNILSYDTLQLSANATGGSGGYINLLGGNVGIGTTSPVTLLDVRGEVSIAYNATYGLRFYNDARNNWSSIGNDITGSAAANLVFKTGYGTVLTLANSGAATFSSSVTAVGALFTAATETRGNIRTTFPSDNSYYSLFSNDGALTLDTYGVGGYINFKILGSTKLTIASTGAATFSSTLEANSTIKVTSASTTGTNINIVNTSSGGYNWNIFSEGSDAIRGPVGSLIFRDSTIGVSRMLITSGGNVLIGTTTDTGHKLAVIGTSRFTEAATIAYSGLSGDFGAGYTTGLGVGYSSSVSKGINMGWNTTLDMGFIGTVHNGTAWKSLILCPIGGSVFIGASSNNFIYAGGYFEGSDKRIKTLIEDNYQTKGIGEITPKLYTKNGKVELGYYAQDFIGVLDSAISKGSDDMLSLSYREVLVAKVYALEQEIKELKAKMN